MDVGQVLDGRFRTDRLVDSGGMGTIYRGTALASGESVAIKVLHGGAATEGERFEREIELLASLSHPAIVRYVAHGRLPTAERFLVMEWIEGQTLAERLAEEGLDLRESVALAARVAQALEAVHEKGLVHRDLKPKNVMLVNGSPYDAKLIDFGIARPGRDQVSLTRTGVLIGSLPYMAPEQARGERAIDGRVDLFALGCVLYECITGRGPFAGTDAVATRTKILWTEPPGVKDLNPDASDALNALTARLLEKAPSRRPGSAKELARALASLHEGPSPRRSHLSRGLATTTRVIANAPAWREDTADFHCLILVAAEEDGADPGTLRPILEGALPEGGRLEVLDDGWSVLMLGNSSTPKEVAHRAARCALRIRAACPDLPIAISAQHSAEVSFEELIDRGANTIVRESVEFHFADLADGRVGIRLDEPTAQLLPDHFEIVQGPTGVYLVAERHAA